MQFVEAIMECTNAIACGVHATPRLDPRRVLSGCGYEERFRTLKASRSCGRRIAGLLPAQFDFSTYCYGFGGSEVRPKRARVTSFGAAVRCPLQPWTRQTVLCKECLITAKAKKDVDGSDEPTQHTKIRQHSVTEFQSFLSSSDFWLQVAIFVFTAGFVDAAFSGDWSRIGVLSKEIEGELQMAAVGVVPLAALLIWSISQRRKRL